MPLDSSEVCHMNVLDEDSRVGYLLLSGSLCVLYLPRAKLIGRRI
jgi:hypothetical protein